MLILTIPFSGPINWDLLKEQAEAAFPDTFIDCNSTDNGATVTIYLDDGAAEIATSPTNLTTTQINIGGAQPLTNAQLTWQNLITSHDASQLSAGQQKAKAKADAAITLSGVDKSTLDPTIAAIVTFLGF